MGITYGVNSFFTPNFMFQRQMTLYRPSNDVIQAIQYKKVGNFIDSEIEEND